ncbi:DNA polymerase domain-containing protein [uncultured Parvimonas sp.]|uniref:DNA polymerase domain-containing protein n=1 Tax=uncultured Parvimonas sp. TaxID=747372 RepID=UPI0025963E21|nr:DNA polymerase domain-containing protein [uncultured Parvimonas sp.]
MIFIDFEVFKSDWLAVTLDTKTEKYTEIVNDREKLLKLYEENKDDIFIGYNIRHYDQYIFKAILLDLDVKALNDYIIISKELGWRYSNLFRDIQLNTYDVMTSMHGLKQLEGFMGNDIRETSVDFNIDRKLTDEEIQESIKYCKHDVEQTALVFFERIEEFQAHMGLIKEFDLPLSDVSKTKVQLSAKILDARKVERDDDFDLKIVDTLKLDKYNYVKEWYQNPINHDYGKELVTDIAGVPHTFAWGGVHGARDKYIKDGIFINVDVGSFYPALMIEYDFLSRNVSDSNKFREIRDKRLEYKKNKDSRQAPLKIVINGTYGAMKYKYSPLYDPRQANNVCVNGQLLLLDLIEKLEPHCEIIQSNTDGVLVRIDSLDDFEIIDDICYEWESRTRMNLEFDTYIKVIQADVNNYIIVAPNGSYKSKGAYVKKLSKLDNDLQIINEAIINYLLKNISVEETILKEKHLIKFQKIVKVSSNYKYAMLGHWNDKEFIGEKLTDKTFRVFASKNSKDGIFKVNNRNPEKFADTPNNIFIENGDIKNKRCPKDLDYTWYIDLAKNRLNKKFGVKM